MSPIIFILAVVLGVIGAFYLAIKYPMTDDADDFQGPPL